MDVNEIFIKKDKKQRKMKGYTNKMAYILTAKSCRELKMAPMYWQNTVLLTSV